MRHTVILSILFPFFLSSQAIHIQGTQFYDNCNNRIWLNGANTPWNSWNDFGGSFNRNWWNTHFQTLKNTGINASRVWISCDGAGAVKTNTTGVTGVSATFYKDCDSLFAIAQRYGIYVLATMMSFDHCDGAKANYQNWRDIITKQANSQTYIDNYLIPFVNRYKSNPYLLIDLCNEPEWISENAANGQLPVSNLQRFFAMCAAAIHTASTVPVSIGSACIKWNSENSGHVGNYWKNSALQAAFNNANAYLDFYQVHYYAWINQWFSNPFQKSPADYGINDRPVIIGECPGKDMSEIPQTITQAFESALSKGYQGMMPWTSNGVDGNGSLATFGSAATSFKNNHAALVYPPCATAVEENMLDEQVFLLPNPANDVVFIECGFLIKELALLNSLGEKVYSEENIMKNNVQISLHTIAPGLYFLSLNSVSGLVTKKLMIGQ